MRVLWEGPLFTNHSLALVNRELVLRLSEQAGLDIAVRPAGSEPGLSWEEERFAPLRALSRVSPTDTDICVRHAWPPNLHPPHSGKWVFFQPWEYGAVPRHWYEPMRFGADEVWVYSSWNRQCYIEGGIPEAKVRTVPLGVQPIMLTEPEPFPLRTRKRFRFLFVGGTIARKGIDLLLDAYVRAFGSADDVCLVIKDFGASSVYRGQTSERFIRELQRKPGAPEIEYITDDLTPGQLRDLYHACDCLIHPFRGEGWGLPIMEAMACGLPVIVPDQGGAADFCTSDTAILLPTRRVNVPPALRGDLDTIGTPWWLEVNPAELREQMRAIYENPASVAGLAREGQVTVRARFTWDAAAEAAGTRLRQIAEAGGSPLHRDACAQYELRMQEGALRWEHGEPHAALRNFALARELRPTPDAEFNIASILHLQGDHRTAAPLLDALARRTEASASEDEQQLRADVQALLAQTPLPGSRAPLANGASARVRWYAPIFNASGYASESRGFLAGLLADARWDVALAPQDAVRDTGILGPEALHPEGAVPQAGKLRRDRLPARTGKRVHRARGGAVRMLHHARDGPHPRRLGGSMQPVHRGVGANRVQP